MPISRGIVRHKIFENVVDLFKSYVQPNLLKSASNLDKAELENAVLKHFPNTRVTLFPFARTCLFSTLQSLQLPERSKILMTPITIGPMVEVIESLGHEVVFVDIETESFGPCLSDLQSKLEAGAACFLLTHLFGYVSAVDQAVALCRKAGVTVIEDISHNIGSKLGATPLGLWGDVAFYSASLLKYVDGYNGAFAVTRNSKIAAALERSSISLTEPDPSRVRAVVLKTLVWNLALNRIIFFALTWPALRILKVVNRSFFEKLLGPGIPFQRARALPNYYFEQATKLQCVTMARNLTKLSARLALRKKMASRASKAFGSLKGRSSSELKHGQDLLRDNTYWQFVVPVKSTEDARAALFRVGVETNTTNLRDLAFEDGIELPNARSLKSNHIFIPLHDYLQQRDYERIFDALGRSGQLEFR
jgi:dTDP-4-amino-4,6-dideoxygalactose transaminase